MMDKKLGGFRGERLRQRRAKLGMTQRDVARSIGMTINQVSRYEKGEAEPGSVALSAISRVLNVSADWLLGHVDAPDDVAESGMSEKDRTLLRLVHQGETLAAVRLVLDYDKQDASYRPKRRYTRPTAKRRFSRVPDSGVALETPTFERAEEV